jgi:hypothetical protein
MAKYLVTAFVVALIGLSLAGHAREIDTEYLFGFLTGTDIGEVGEKELESETTGRLAKRAGSYSAFSQTNAVEFVPVQNLRVEPGVVLVRHDIAGANGLDEVRRTSLQGLSLDLRYQILDRRQSGIGFSLRASPHWGRIDELSGQPVEQYGSDFGLLFDYEPLPDRVAAVFNLVYEPQTTRMRNTGQWSQDAMLGFGTGVMALIRPGFLIGGEVRYVRAYDSFGLNNFAGQALFVGPNIFVKPAEGWRVTAAWGVQVAGQSVSDTGALDLMHFTRHEVRIRVGHAF